MLERPGLGDDRIRMCLEAHYGLTVTGIEFLPLGFDSYAGVYRVEAREGGSVTRPYFLKVKGDEVSAISLALPHTLNRQGITAIVAPLPTVTGDLRVMLDAFTLVLYPFIEGESRAPAALTEGQWEEFGGLLRAIHTAQLPREVRFQLPPDEFEPNPKWARITERIHAEILHRSYDHPLQQELAAFWREKHDEIGQMLERAEQVGRMLRGRDHEWSVCHADMHTGNLLIDAGGGLHIVDWDQPVLAPKERDLMFMVDGPGEAAFFRGYGAAAIDAAALAFYHYGRVIEDLGGFGEVVFYMDSGDDTRRESIGWVRKQFEPGYHLHAAYKWDRIASKGAVV